MNFSFIKRVRQKKVKTRYLSVPHFHQFAQIEKFEPFLYRDKN